MFAALLTIGNELVSGDVPDELDAIVDFVRREAARVDHLIVTGGLGGTPDDITREALAVAFDVPQENVPELEADLRGRFTRDPDYAARWALLPQGSAPLENPRARLPDRERLGPAGAAVGDGGDVRPVRRRVPRQRADRVVEARPAARRERDRASAHPDDRALAGCARRVVPALPPRPAGGRGGAEIGGRSGACGGGLVGRAGARG